MPAPSLHFFMNSIILTFKYSSHKQCKINSVQSLKKKKKKLGNRKKNPWQTYFYSIIFSSWDQIREAEQSLHVWRWLMVETCFGEGVVAVTSYCRSLVQPGPSLSRSWAGSGFVAGLYKSCKAPELKNLSCLRSEVEPLKCSQAKNTPSPPVDIEMLLFLCC